MNKLPEGFQEWTGSPATSNTLNGFQEWTGGDIAGPAKAEDTRRPASSDQAPPRKPASVDEFVQQISPIAQRIAQKIGAPVEAVIGQLGLETGWGKSVIPGTNNYGNIKDTSGKGVAATDNMTGSRDRYRQYATPEEFADDYAKLVGTNPRYKGAVGAKDAQGFFTGLKQGGYAEDPNYVQSGVAASRTAAESLKKAGFKQESSSLPDMTGIPKWSEISTSEKFSKLPDAEKARTKSAYFDELIAPYVAAEGLDVASEKAKFIGVSKKEEPGLISRAADAAAGVLKAMNPFSPTPGLMEGVSQTVRQENTDRFNLPLSADTRAKLDYQYERATPEQRAQLSKADGVVGMYFTERNKQHAERDKLTQSPSELISDPASADIADPRFEARTRQLIRSGMTAEGAKTYARTEMQIGMTPGGIKPGSATESDFDFELQDRFKNAPAVIRGAVKGYQGYKQGSLGILHAAADAIGSDDAAAKFAKGSSEAQGVIDAVGDNKNKAGQMFEGAISSISQQMPMLIGGAVTGSEAIVLGSMAVQSFGQEYAQGRSQNLSGGDAAKRASLFAAFEVVGEKFGLGNTLKALRMSAAGAPTKDLAMELSKALIKEIPGEVLTTTGQFATDKVGSFGLNKEAGMAEYLSQVGDTIGQTVMQSALMMGGTGGVSTTARHLQNRSNNGAQLSEIYANDARDRALSKWESNPLVRPAQSPQATQLPQAAPQSPQAHPTSQVADAVVRDLAAAAGMDVESLIPAKTLPAQPAAVEPIAAVPEAQGDSGIADQSSTPESRELDLWLKSSDVGLTPDEQAELSALQNTAPQEQTQNGIEQWPAASPDVATQSNDVQSADVQGSDGDHRRDMGEGQRPDTDAEASLSSAGEDLAIRDEGPSVQALNPSINPQQEILSEPTPVEAQQAAPQGFEPQQVQADAAPGITPWPDPGQPVGPAQTRAPSRTRTVPDDLLGMLNASGGISSSIRSDIDQDAKGRPGLYRASGRNIDEIGALMAEYGYIAPDEANDSAVVLEMLRRAVGGERIMTAQGMENMRAKEDAGRYRSELVSQAKQLGINPVGKSTDRLAAVIEQEMVEREAIFEKRKQELIQESADAEQAIEDVLALFGSDSPSFRWMADKFAEISARETSDQRKSGYDSLVRAARQAIRKWQADQSRIESVIERSLEDGYGSQENPFGPSEGIAGQTEPVSAAEGDGPGGVQSGDRRGQGFVLEAPTEQTLAEKVAREQDQALADKQTADAQREGFTLDAQPAQESRSDSTADMFGGPSVADFQKSQERAGQQAGQTSEGDLFAQSNTRQMTEASGGKAYGEAAAETKAADQEKLAQDFRLYPDIVMGEIMQRGELPALMKGTGKRVTSGFNALRLDDRAKAYADYVANGGKPVDVPADYNEWVQRQYDDAEQRRKDDDKPLAQLAEERRIAEGRPSYMEAQAQALRELGIKENAEGEPEATEEQWAKVDARTDAILRGDVSQKAEKVSTSAEPVQNSAETEQIAATAKSKPNQETKASSGNGSDQFGAVAEMVSQERSAQESTPARSYVRLQSFDHPSVGVLNNLREQKDAAWSAVKKLKAQISDGRNDLRVKLIQAESAHKDLVRQESSARESVEEAANTQGLTTYKPSRDESSGPMFSRSESATPPTTDLDGMRSTPISKENKLAMVFSALGKFEDAFQRETPVSTAMEDIAREVMPGAQVRKLNSELPQEWDLTGLPETWEIATKDSPNRVGRFMSDGKHVWIDVSRLLASKDMGSAMYAIAAAYAHNNGQVFIGDPAGLSPIAFFRRLENMISSAIKYGTTDHLMPHTAQMNPESYYAKEYPDFAKAVAGLGLQWKTGDFGFNLKQMLLTSYNAAKQFMPGIEDIEYDFTNGGFRRVSDHARVDRSDLQDFPRKDVGEGSQAGKRYYAGGATAARAILTQSISRSQGAEVWPSVLAGMRSQLRGRRLDPSLTKIFYSKQNQNQEQIAREIFGNPNPKSTVDQITKELSGEGSLGSNIKVIQSALDLPANERRQVFKSSSADIGLQAVFFPDSGRVYLIADNIEPGEALSALLHDGGVHAGLYGMLGERGINSLAAQIKDWSINSLSKEEGRIARLALDRIPENTSPEHRNEEAVAYFVTEAVKAGHGDPKPTQSTAISRWFAKLWKMVESAIQKLGADPSKLTVDDVVALARGALEKVKAGEIDPLRNDTIQTMPSNNSAQGQQGGALPGADSKRTAAVIPESAESRRWNDYLRSRKLEERNGRIFLSGGGTELIASRVKKDYELALPSIVAKEKREAAKLRRDLVGTKIVGDDGLPKILYHGTDKYFDVFEKSSAGTKGELDLGVWLTDDYEYADWIASGVHSKYRNDNAQIKPVYLNSRNPLVFDILEEARSSASRDGLPLPETQIEAQRFFAGSEGWDEFVASLAQQAKQKGYDSLVLKNFDDNFSVLNNWRTTAYIAFDPSQVVLADKIESTASIRRKQSATGNDNPSDDSTHDILASRSYSPEQDAFRKKAGIGNRPTIKQKLQRWADGMLGSLSWDAFRQGALDQFHGVKLAELATIGALPVEQSAYVTSRLATGASSVMAGLLGHGQARWAANGQHLEKIEGTKGLLDILKPVEGQIDDFLGWMVANRASRLMKEGRENNFTEADIQAGLSLANGKEDLFKQVAKDFADFKRGVLDIAEQAGLIDPAGRKVWDHADWIPFYRQMQDDAVKGPGGKRGLSKQSSGIRQLKGGDSAINDPLENILMNFQHLIDASLKNNALRKVIGNVAGKTNSDEFLESVGYGMQGAIVSRDQIKKQLMTAGTPQQMIDALPSSALLGMAKMWALKAPEGKDIIRVMENGKPHFYRVTDPLLLKAVTSFEPFNVPGLATMRAFKRLLTRSVTATPAFMVRNFVRDWFSSAIISRDSTNVISALRGAVKSFSQSGGYEQMMFAGASFAGGQTDGADPEATAKAMRRELRKKGFSAASADEFMASILDRPIRMWDAYSKIGEAIENANREAMFEAAKRAGKSDTAAAFEALDLMDFRLRGSHAAYQMFADIIPFVNARVQGLYRLGRSNPKQVAIRGGLLLLIPSVLLALANAGNDEYEELPDWDKDTYWHFFIGGHHFRLPKPFEVGVMFGTIPERITRAMLGNDSPKKLAARVWFSIADQFSLVQWPQFAKPALEVAMNEDGFSKRPIETVADKSVIPSMRASYYTSDTMKALAGMAPGVSDATGMSPKRMQHLWNGYLGSVGAAALSVSDFAVRRFQGLPFQESMRRDEYPLLGVFYREAPAKNSGYVEEIYKMAKDASELKKSYETAMKSGMADYAKQILAGNKEKISMAGGLDHAASQMSGASKKIEAIRKDTALSASEKRDQIDAVIKRRNEIAEKVAKRAIKAWGGSI